jgi:Tfp pilus assembly protein PilF
MRPLAALLAIAMLTASCSPRPAQSPELPRLDMANFLPGVRTEIQAAYDAAQTHPEDPVAAGKLGMLLDAHEQYEAAAKCYLRAHRLAPGEFAWPYHLACIRSAQGQPEDAIALFNTALLIRDYPPARLKLADAMLAAGKIEASLTAYEKIVTAEPSNAAAWYGLGRASEARGDIAKAIDCYRRACDIFPAYGAARYALALASRKRGEAGFQEQFRLAEQNKTAVPFLDDPVRAAVHTLSAGTDVHVRRAAALEQQGRIQEAVDEHLLALQLDPKFVQAHINLISLYARLGDYGKAEEHYRSAIALAPAQADAEYNYGVLLFGRGRLDQAERAFRRALAANPQHAQAHHNLGFLLEQQGRLPAALEEYEKAVESQPDYRLAHFHAGRILANERKYGPAIAHLRKTIDAEDDAAPGYLYALAAAYARADQIDNAIVYARRARDSAAAHRQTELLASIEKDLRLMQARQGAQ